MKKLKQLVKYLICRPIWCTFLFSVVIGVCRTLISARELLFSINSFPQVLVSIPQAGILSGIFCISPVLLTIYNIVFLLLSNRSEQCREAGRSTELFSICFGALCFLLYAFGHFQIRWGKDWTEQLYNYELHTPIATWTLPTVITIAAVAVAGYLILRSRKITNLPPLLAVLSISGIYLGAVLSVLWIIQLSADAWLTCLPLCLYPFNLILIAAKVIKEVILDFQAAEHPLPEGKAPVIRALHLLLMDAKSWPWLAVLCALPLLGILIAVLVLFGQAPDSIIQAWTQTSDWTFSQQIAPQNIYTDMHYLCTVSAGGHPKLVKPIREGKRHGHKVLVNRQLCIANAFEQLLEERIPRIHRLIRRIYDRYGYPIAKHIRSPYVADAVWLLMKPLEWFFLAVLYLFDPKPENRIAVQYPHAPIPKQ